MSLVYEMSVNFFVPTEVTDQPPSSKVFFFLFYPEARGPNSASGWKFRNIDEAKYILEILKLIGPANSSVT